MKYPVMVNLNTCEGFSGLHDWVGILGHGTWVGIKIGWNRTYSCQAFEIGCNLVFLIGCSPCHLEFQLVMIKVLRFGFSGNGGLNFAIR
jgi:hypothetical protein